MLKTWFFCELNNSKQKKIQKKILVKNFLSLGGGYLGAKNKNFKNCSKHDFFANWTILSQKKNFPKKNFWPFFRFLSPPKSPKNENFEKMKKTTPDIFLKYHKNPQTHILDKLASRECAPTDAKKWDRHTYILGC